MMVKKRTFKDKVIFSLEKAAVNGMYQFFATMSGLYGYGYFTSTQISISDAFLPVLFVSFISAGLAFSKTLKDFIEKEEKHMEWYERQSSEGVQYNLLSRRKSKPNMILDKILDLLVIF